MRRVTRDLRWVDRVPLGQFVRYTRDQRVDAQAWVWTYLAMMLFPLVGLEEASEVVRMVRYREVGLG